MRNGSRILKVAVAGLLLAAVACAPVDDGGQTAGQRKAEARDMVQSVLNSWDYKTWNQLLDEQVVLNLNVGSVDAGAAVGVRETIRGREAAKAMLREYYGELEKSVSFWGEIAEGYEVVLLGDLRVAGAADTTDELPFIAYLVFNESGKVKEMTLATVDLRPLVRALEQSAGS